ncbi:U-box domain-containing protein 19-like [Malania oleifera]|uniref:U-box domain-containing protein 19-like n=1 Tax=Malania oleifera TaxID=397392 RepID=UPI0025AE1795|nr:U-box domain-containing protein 19-like [Malania oleifera]
MLFYLSNLSPFFCSLKVKSLCHRSETLLQFSMIYNSDEWGRRVLTFPAIRPCESVSPATLLGSLITLAGDICGFKAKFFASNKRNAWESIRQVGVLLVFLEVVRETQLVLPDSIGLSFSELHLAFQKIRFLLEDCTREYARLWIAMKSEQFAVQFRVLIRSIATALDALTSESINVSGDAKELIELVQRQSRKARFEVESNDKQISEKVLAILNQFRDNTAPEESDLKWVLDRLGIRSWSDCEKEIKFLDSEIALELTNAEKEVTFLSSLMGFMTYCRCVLFNAVDYGVPWQSGGGCNEVLKTLNPDDFRCPISLEIMTDPVTISSGHTYDRSSIQKWFGAGNSTCPKTGKKLKNTTMVPNSVLRGLIRQYCSNNGIPIGQSDAQNCNTVKRVVEGKAEAAMKMVCSFLVRKLAVGTSEERNKAAYEIKLLTKTSIYNRSCLAEAGAIPHLLSLLSSSDSIIQENAMAALSSLSKHSKGKAMVAENGGLKLVSQVLKKGPKFEVRLLAAATLYYLASVEEYRRLIGKIPEAIPGLVELIKNGTDCGKKNALVAVSRLLMYPGNHKKLLATRAVPMLLNILTSSEREDLAKDSLLALSILAEKPDGTHAILSGRGGLNLLVGVLNSLSSKMGKEYCASLLLALCINGGNGVVGVLAKNPSVMGPLYSMLAGGSPQGRKKASSLINTLQNFYERSSDGSIKPLAARRGQLVHI